MEPYIFNPNFKQRQAVSKLRISDHKLQTELGKYHKLSLELNERTRPFCPNKIEDEYHFIAECPMYNDERHWIKTALSLTQTSDYKFFTNISNCRKEFMKGISCFILEIMDKRTEALELTEISNHSSLTFLIMYDTCLCALFCIGMTVFHRLSAMGSSHSFMKEYGRVYSHVTLCGCHLSIFFSQKACELLLFLVFQSFSFQLAWFYKLQLIMQGNSGTDKVKFCI